MSTRKKTRYDPVVKTPITCDIITLLIKEIQIIDGDQKEDFPLWEVHIKKIFFQDKFVTLALELNHARTSVYGSELRAKLIATKPQPKPSNTPVN